MKKNIISIWLITACLSISCSDTTNDVIPITDYFSFGDGYEWTYEVISLSDTSLMYSDFDMSQLSDNEEIALLEVYGVEIPSTVLAIKGHKQGICIDVLEISLEKAKSTINSLDVDCAALLKYPVNSGDKYSYSYELRNRTYDYNVDVTTETLEVEAGTFQVFKYSIPSGSLPNRDINEVYFSPEVGLVKFYPEFEIGSEPLTSFTLIDVNF